MEIKETNIAIGEATVSVFTGDTIVRLCNFLRMDVIRFARLIRADYTSVVIAKQQRMEPIPLWMEKKIRRRLAHSGIVL